MQKNKRDERKENFSGLEKSQFDGWSVMKEDPDRLDVLY